MVEVKQRKDAGAPDANALKSLQCLQHVFSRHFPQLFDPVGLLFKCLGDQRDVPCLGVGESAGQQFFLGGTKDHGRRDDGILKLLLQPAIDGVGRSAGELLSCNDADQRLKISLSWFRRLWLQVLDHYSQNWI